MSMTEPRLQFAVLTLFPEAFDAVTQWGVTGRAFESGLCALHLQNPRDEGQTGTVLSMTGLMAEVRAW